MKDRIQKLEEQRRQLEAKLEALRAKGKESERKADNKRKFLLGSMLQQWMTEDPAIREQALQRCEKFLTRKSDRRYFGFDPLPGSADDEAPKARKKRKSKATTEAEATVEPEMVAAE